MDKYKFPKGFLWGAGTSSHQVEGGNNNDWTEWEKSGHVKNNDQSGKAADHWNLYEEDFDLIEELNLNAYRFSIEWSRIEPHKGQFDENAINHYRKMLESLKKRSITPIVTLHHFTNPLWLPDWTHKENTEHFLSYSNYVVEKLGDLVDNWCTINEPMNVVLLGYAGKIWPPGYGKLFTGLKAAKVFADTHNRTYKLIHEMYVQKDWDKPLVGIPLSIPHLIQSRKNNVLDRFATNMLKILKAGRIQKKVINHTDYIGLNYYHTLHSKWYSPKSFTDITNGDLALPRNDMGWNIEPEGIYHLVTELHKKYNLPIFITENGLADAQDKLRKWYINTHLSWLGRAISEGVDVRGYIHWSLIDNFEWADGYFGRFGLVAVDFETQKRTVRASAWAYADIAKSNEVSKEIEVASL